MNLKGTHYTCFGCIAPPDSRIIISEWTKCSSQSIGQGFDIDAL